MYDFESVLVRRALLVLWAVFCLFLFVQFFRGFALTSIYNTLADSVNESFLSTSFKSDSSHLDATGKCIVSDKDLSKYILLAYTGNNNQCKSKLISVYNRSKITIISAKYYKQAKEFGVKSNEIVTAAQETQGLTKTKKSDEGVNYFLIIIVVIGVIAIIVSIIIAHNTISVTDKGDDSCSKTDDGYLYPIRNAFEAVSKFCAKNNINLAVSTMQNIVSYTETDSSWSKLVSDLKTCKTRKSLLSNGCSPDWLRAYFLYSTNFTVLPREEMRAVSVNYLRDILAFYDKAKREYGVEGLLDRVNCDLMLNLLAQDIDFIREVVDANQDVKSKDKVELLKSEEQQLMEKYDGTSVLSPIKGFSFLPDEEDDNSWNI